jgi:hypothetical protein
MKKPKPVRSILEHTLKGLEMDVHLKAYSIWGSWKEIVGESMARQTQPRVIRNRILFMDVSHSTWMQQLQFLKPALLEKVNTFIGEPYLLDIRFRLGKITPAVSPPSRTSSWQEEELDEKTLKKIEDLLPKIDDREVRESLRKVLIKGTKLERYRKNQT